MYWGRGGGMIEKRETPTCNVRYVFTTITSLNIQDPLNLATDM